jgi:hypothetical protein
MRNPLLPSATLLPLLLLLSLSPDLALSCTNILVSPGASADGSTILAYNADSGALYGSIGHYPATKHAPNATRDVWWGGAGVGLCCPHSCESDWYKKRGRESDVDSFVCALLACPPDEP